MLQLKYIADVDLQKFCKANDWNKQDMELMIKEGRFKIIKKMEDGDRL